MEPRDLMPLIVEGLVPSHHTSPFAADHCRIAHHHHQLVGWRPELLGGFLDGGGLVRGLAGVLR
jgi:hypothetical protein